MRKFLFYLGLLLLCGCSGLRLTGNSGDIATLQHENQASQLLSEEEFMARATRSATLLYQGMLAISDAAKQYAAAHDNQLPRGTTEQIKHLLLDGGFLDVWPVVPPFAFVEQIPNLPDFRYKNNHDDMDGIGAMDDIIYVQDLKLEVCEEFSRLYSSFSPETVIHDFVAARERYPGEVFGRHITVYAINWSMEQWPDYCEVEWVMKYND